jgi:Zn finger protein HypA/HybF involved in hydrogenase expression
MQYAWEKESKEKLLAQVIQDKEAIEKAYLEIKQLRGIIPICADCKKIRNDKGYWEQVEQYISDHSQAEFTHSICPNCAKKMLDQET